MLSNRAIKAATRMLAGETFYRRKREPMLSPAVYEELLGAGMLLNCERDRYSPQHERSFAARLKVEKVERANRRLLAKAIEEHDGEILAYRNLSPPAQCALAHYRAIDRNDWERPASIPFLMKARTPQFIKTLRRARIDFVRRHGDEEFGVVTFPRQVAIDLCWATMEPYQNYPSFAKYHRWYLGHVTDKHPPEDRWPAILDWQGAAFLQDGWHRFHRYLDLGVEELEFLYYP